MQTTFPKPTTEWPQAGSSHWAMNRGLTSCFLKKHQQPFHWCLSKSRDIHWEDGFGQLPADTKPAGRKERNPETRRLLSAVWLTSHRIFGSQNRNEGPLQSWCNSEMVAFCFSGRNKAWRQPHPQIISSGAQRTGQRAFPKVQLKWPASSNTWSPKDPCGVHLTDKGKPAGFTYTPPLSGEKQPPSLSWQDSGAANRFSEKSPHARALPTLLHPSKKNLSQSKNSPST